MQINFNTFLKINHVRTESVLKSNDVKEGFTIPKNRFKLDDFYLKKKTHVLVKGRNKYHLSL